MPDKAWKRTEREIAKIFGGVRAGPQGKEGPDILTETFAVEVKHRAVVPALVRDAMAQILACAPAGTLPVVVVHPKGALVRDSLVIIRLGDFAEWYL